MSKLVFHKMQSSFYTSILSKRCTHLLHIQNNIFLIKHTVREQCSKGTLTLKSHLSKHRVPSQPLRYMSTHLRPPFTKTSTAINGQATVSLSPSRPQSVISISLVLSSRSHNYGGDTFADRVVAQEFRNLQETGVTKEPRCSVGNESG